MSTDSIPSGQALTPALVKMAAANLQISRIPGFVIDKVNQLLIEACAQNSSPNSRSCLSVTLSTEKIIEALKQEAIERKQQYFDLNWLKFEPIFSIQGWSVRRTSGSDDEPDFFTFSQN